MISLPLPLPHNRYDVIVSTVKRNSSLFLTYSRMKHGVGFV